MTALFSFVLSVRGLWSLATRPAPVVQQPEHRKAYRTAEVIGADRVLAATAAPSSIQGEPPNVQMEPTARFSQAITFAHKSW